MIKKLLAATSVAALIAGGAQAQLALEQTSVPGGPGIISGTYALASEVDFDLLNEPTNAKGIGNFGLNVLTEGVIPPGQNIFLTITVTNGTIAKNLNGSEFAGVAGPGASPGGVTGAVVNAGGTVGSTSVRYLLTTDSVDLSTDTLATRDGVALQLPIRASSCGDVTFAVTEFATESGGTPIEGGTAVLTSGVGAAKKVVPAITCSSAVEATLKPDTNISTLALVSTPTTLGAFSQFVTTGPSTDALTVATLGDFANKFATGTFYRNLGNLVADQFVPANIVGFKADVDFLSPTRVVSGAAVPGVPPAAPASMFNTAGAVAVSGADINLVGTVVSNGSDAGTFALTIAGTGPIAAQSVTVSDAVLQFDVSAGLKASEPFKVADVEDLKYEGAVFGPFDWVSDSTKAVNSIFRVTGLSTTEDIPAQVIVENSRNGEAFNGVYPFTILGSSVQGSEIRPNSAFIESLAGQFGTADITWVFSTTRDIDVDRLNASPSSSVVTPFGDGANQDGAAGVDSTLPATSTNDDQGNF